MTLEGTLVWGLVLRLGGQLRISEGRVRGWDMTAALALARARGCEAAAAELLPWLEPVVSRAMNGQR